MVSGAIIAQDTLTQRGSHPYEEFSVTVVAPGTHLTFAATGLATNGGGFVVFDDAQLNAVPEVDPKSGAAPVALALGGLMLMGDRRRRQS
jgi:hypothetical protein